MSRSIWVLSFKGKRYDVRAMPNRPFVTTKTYRDDDGAYFARNPKGEWFCSLVRGGSAICSLNKKGLHILIGIAELGALSVEDAKAAREQHEAQHKAEMRVYEAEQLEEYAATIGLKLTAAQRRTLKRIKREGAA